MELYNNHVLKKKQKKTKNTDLTVKPVDSSSNAKPAEIHTGDL